MKPELQQGKFLKFFRRFVREGWLKACFVALTLGFAVSAILYGHKCALVLPGHRPGGYACGYAYLIYGLFPAHGQK